MEQESDWRSPSMVRVGISVEGVTEERFIKISLAPHLAQQAIFVTPVSMGGNVSIDRVRYEINKLIYHFDVVTTFYDFYGFRRKQKNETKDSLEAQILESVPKAMQGKVIPYIQMYEFEGRLSIKSFLKQKNYCQFLFLFF